MRKLIIAIIGLVAGSNLSAQQSPLSNFYNFNTYLLNPAEAGAKGSIEGTASHRIQWQGVEGAPKTTFLGVHGSLNETMGIGGKITVDQTDILKQFNAALSYSYKVMLNEKAKLHFGVSALMVQNSVGYSDAVVGDLADDVVNGGDESGIAFDAEAGMMLEYGKGKIGISTVHLFESGVAYNLPEDRGTGTFERVRQFTSYASYTFEVSENWDVEPMVLIRNQGVGSFQTELNAMSSWRNTLYLGLGYRQEAGFIGRIGFQVTDLFIAAYAYEFSGSGVASYSGGSHEFMIGYKLGKQTKEMPEIKKELAPEPVMEKPEAPKEDLEEEARMKKQQEEEILRQEQERRKAVEKAEKVEKLKETLDQNIPFNFETDKLSENTQKSLAEMAEELKKNPDMKVIIKGHTCNMGNDEVNTRYSLKRANKVKDYFLAEGVNLDQMEVKAMRDTEPLVPNTSLENRKKNRRVEIELLK